MDLSNWTTFGWIAVIIFSFGTAFAVGEHWEDAETYKPTWAATLAGGLVCLLLRWINQGYYTPWLWVVPGAFLAITVFGLSSRDIEDIQKSWRRVHRRYCRRRCCDDIH